MFTPYFFPLGYFIRFLSSLCNLATRRREFHLPQTPYFLFYHRAFARFSRTGSFWRFTSSPTLFVSNPHEVWYENLEDRLLESVQLTILQHLQKRGTIRAWTNHRPFHIIPLFSFLFFSSISLCFFYFSSLFMSLFIDLWILRTTATVEALLRSRTYTFHLDNIYFHLSL